MRRNSGATRTDIGGEALEPYLHRERQPSPRCQRTQGPSSTAEVPSHKHEYLNPVRVTAAVQCDVTGVTSELSLPPTCTTAAAHQTLNHCPASLSCSEVLATRFSHRKVRSVHRARRREVSSRRSPCPFSCSFCASVGGRGCGSGCGGGASARGCESASGAGGVGYCRDTATVRASHNTAAQRASTANATDDAPTTIRKERHSE